MKENSSEQFSKDDLVSINTHQLKTPLSGNKWAIHHLLSGAEGPLTESQKELLQEIYEKNDRALKLAENTLIADQAESQMFDFKFSEVSLSEIIEKIIRRIVFEADKKGIELNFTRLSDSVSPVLGDQERLSYVFENIIGDAVRYTPSPGEVSVSIKDEGDKIVVEVHDSGIGIPEEEQGNIFNKFFRAKNARSTDAPGTGLGLFISKKIVEAHKGTITFDSKEGKGTTFWVSIPSKKDYNG
jgi:signal transduction histidine kinase